ncbi:anti-sigma factor family protein [Streptomyces sp. NRRL F-5123]|uniref:anti-sigma factor family protein n=1 Tax=Streptomyces sp. NRRL F-5123 TaxID=1463856 RepID=UPI0004E1F38D|nr:zf-HC2 domain-containing protein [Streptomyces sp. NRRL F-5123]
MTSRTDQNAHPDVIEIADLAEGILSAERAAQVRAHVDSCADCADVLASLQEISGLLAELPEPEAMPSDVAARIDAALAAEPLPVTEQPDVPRETARPTPGGFHGDVPRGTSAPAGRPAGPTGPGRARERGRRMLLLTAAGAAAVLVLGGITYQLTSRSGSSGNMKSDSSAAAKGSNHDDAPPDPVASDVARLLGGARSSGGPANSPMLSEKGDTVVAAPNGTVTSVPSCVLKGTQRTDKPLAAERKPYQGVDSFVVVLPDPDSSSLVDAYVLTSSCNATTPAQVLFQNSYPRD